MDLRVNLAGVNVLVKFEAPGVRTDPVFEPFRFPNPTGARPQLTLEFPRSCDFVPQGLEPVRGPGRTSVRRTADGFWFERSSGYLATTADFSSCRAWRTDGRAPYKPPFSGRPWLMLALWGYLSQRNGALLHGGVSVLDGHFIMLLGDKEAGKSTLSRLVVEAGHTSLTDENPFLSWEDDAAWAHGTPWPGIAGQPSALAGPLHAIFFLHHAPENQITRLSPADGGFRLLGNARFFQWDPATTVPTVELLDRTVRSVPIYDYGFVPTSEAVEALRASL